MKVEFIATFTNAYGFADVYKSADEYGQWCLAEYIQWHLGKFNVALLKWRKIDNREMF